MAGMPDESNLGSVGGGGAGHTVRRIRDGLSVLCIIACVALLIAWVRSYRMADRLHGKFWGRQSFIIASKQGRVTLVSHRWEGPPAKWHWEVLSFPASAEHSFPLGEETFTKGTIRMYESALGFGVIQRPLIAVPPFRPEEPFDWERPPSILGPVDVDDVEFSPNVIFLNKRKAMLLNGSAAIVPYWFLVLVTGILAAGLLMRRTWRYSLRGILLTIAFAAVLLGLVTILDRAPLPRDDHPGNVDEVMDVIRAIEAQENG
jgi:hypothetical protein